ncbi:MAG: hypothetical protein KF866_00325 [Phycisphaeraceae bacterium]|nr:hypothetical protein [Phycisphaeraceae bacterium]MCW5753633.1 hypothetical protein [Phycisphaeraceae bacterium]
MSDEKSVYGIEPEDSGQQKGQGATPAKPADAAPPEEALPKARAAGAKIDAPGLLDDFDEDADLEADPEVEAKLIEAGVKKPPRRPRTAEAFAGDPKRWFVQPGFPGLRAGGAIAGVVAAGALISKAATAETAPLLSTLHLFHQLLLHTLTGVLACIITARLTERGLNRPETAAVRMGIAVSAFYLIFGLDISIPGRVDEFLLASAAYVGVLFLCFRLPRRETGVLACCHFGFWLFVIVGDLLANRVAGAGAAGG